MFDVNDKKNKCNCEEKSIKDNSKKNLYINNYSKKMLITDSYKLEENKSIILG